MGRALTMVVAAAALVAACAVQIPPPPELARQGPADFPDDYYRQVAARGKPVFRVDPVDSQVVVEVRRAGSLAHLGHDHVVASHEVAGYLAPGDGRADLYVRLDRLVVDEPGLRAEAGFDTQPPESVVAGTRRNMLDKVLEADRYPFALISVARVDTVAGGSRSNVAITLHGTTRAMQVPVEIDARGDEIGVTGRLAVDQTDFGIVPFSVLGGAIQVEDRLQLGFRIRARRIAERGAP